MDLPCKSVQVCYYIVNTQSLLDHVSPDYKMDIHVRTVRVFTNLIVFDCETSNCLLM